MKKYFCSFFNDFSIKKCQGQLYLNPCVECLWERGQKDCKVGFTLTVSMIEFFCSNNGMCSLFIAIETQMKMKPYNFRNNWEYRKLIMFIFLFFLVKIRSECIWLVIFELFINEFWY